MQRKPMMDPSFLKRLGEGFPIQGRRREGDANPASHNVTRPNTVDIIKTTTQLQIIPVFIGRGDNVPLSSVIVGDVIIKRGVLGERGGGRSRTGTSKLTAMPRM